jgi:hypothetical protein
VVTLSRVEGAGYWQKRQRTVRLSMTIDEALKPNGAGLPDPRALEIAGFIGVKKSCKIIRYPNQLFESEICLTLI